MRCSWKLAGALTLVAAMAAAPMGALVTHAATGNLAGSVSFDQQCSLPLGAGVTFDGKNLWYSCEGSSPDLYRADPTTGQVTASFNVAGGLGAIAYDAGRNAIWAGFGQGSGGDLYAAAGNPGDIYLIQLDGTKNVTSASLKFMDPGNLDPCDPTTIDGIAYDASNDTVYVAPECSDAIYQYKTDGTLLNILPWYGANVQPCATNGVTNASVSGLAVGGSVLLEASNNCNHIWGVDKNSGKLEFDFSSQVAGDPNSRGLGLTCDDTTFGSDVVWSKEAGYPMRAHAFEIPAGSCVPGSAQVPTKVAYTGATSGDYGDTVTLSGTLTDANGTPVSGAALKLEADGQNCTGTTSSSGAASCTLTLNELPGNYPLSASFAGDGAHAGSGATGTFTVTREETTLTPASATLYVALTGPATLSSTLSVDGSAPLAGRPVAMALGSGSAGQSCTGFTNASGVASCTISRVTVALGSQPVSASFAGDNYYKPASASGQAMVYAGLTGGTFVVGDKSATMNATVTFWGNRWAQQNAFSGGPAAPGHFGYAAQVSSNPVSVGATWSMTPGASARPPASVPTYMAVAVTSGASGHGASFTGKVSAVAIVHTNAGYSASPSGTGAGTVVALLHS